MIDPDTRDTISHPSYILTIQRGAMWNHFEGQNFFVYGWCFLHAPRHSLASTTRRRVGRPVGFSLGLQRLMLSIGSLAALMACIKLALSTVMTRHDSWDSISYITLQCKQSHRQHKGILEPPTFHIRRLSPQVSVQTQAGFLEWRGTYNAVRTRHATWLLSHLLFKF